MVPWRAEQEKDTHLEGKRKGLVVLVVENRKEKGHVGWKRPVG